MIINSQFKPAWWLPNGHSQTIYPTLFRRIKASVAKRERIELPDGDFIDLAWAVNHLPEHAPLVILLHGLGGSINSSYVAGLMQALSSQGFRVVLMHFRGASGEPNRLLRAYHSGDTADLDYLIKLLAKREPAALKAVVGFSLGGNVLLKWLGENAGQSLITTAIAVSVPFQLRLSADKLSRGFSRCYQSYLLWRLKRVYANKLQQLAIELPSRNINDCRCFWTFDEYVTAPLHGFSGVHAYYRQASSLPYLTFITTPTLIIQAKDDPFVSDKALPLHEQISPAVTLELSARGGHVGFISGSIPGKPVYWVEQRISAYLNEFFNEQPA